MIPIGVLAVIFGTLITTKCDTRFIVLVEGTPDTVEKSIGACIFK
jgi:hypothetical protein